MRVFSFVTLNSIAWYSSRAVPGAVMVHVTQRGQPPFLRFPTTAVLYSFFGKV
jgi:hypothetical protein